MKFSNSDTRAMWHSENFTKIHAKFRTTPLAEKMIIQSALLQGVAVLTMLA